MQVILATGLALQRPLNDAVAEQLRHKGAACEQSVAAQNVEVAAPGIRTSPDAAGAGNVVDGVSGAKIAQRCASAAVLAVFFAKFV